jgi:hypothetical protein
MVDVNASALILCSLFALLTRMILASFAAMQAAALELRSRAESWDYQLSMA